MIKRRIYISAAADRNLEQDQLAIKKAILRAIENEGFEPQEFLGSGIPTTMAWSFEAVSRVMSRCQGAAILAFGRWRWIDNSFNSLILPSEYNHFEGALAFSHGLPLLVVADQDVRKVGIISESQIPIVFRPNNTGPEWISDASFTVRFKQWCTQVNSRPDVFLGYCSKARSTAYDIARYMEHELKLKVHEYSMDFLAGRSILEQIEEASRDCACGVFLFTKDDQLEGGEGYAAPRDNVIFEAGYFMHAKGKERALIIREEGAKLPADLGGNIYISLKDRNEISSIHTQLRRFLENQL